jgi:hypothetical protein
MSVDSGQPLGYYLNVSTQRSACGVTVKCQYTAVRFWSDIEMSVHCGQLLE